MFRVWGVPGFPRGGQARRQRCCSRPAIPANTVFRCYLIQQRFPSCFETFHSRLLSQWLREVVHTVQGVTYGGPRGGGCFL